MHIETSLSFPADPVTVFGLLSNQDFLADVAVESGALDHLIRIEGDTTTSDRTLPAPESAHKFVGQTLRIIEKRVWSAPSANGSRTAVLSLTAEGQPIGMQGTITLAPEGNGSRINISGELKVSIPLVGKKIEKMAAPAVEDGIRAEERVGLRWLQR